MDFLQYLKELTGESTKLNAASLQLLSGLNPGQQRELASVWPRIAPRRRRQIVRDLLDLAEDNVEYNFDAVFSLGLTDEDADVRLESVRGLWEHEDPDVIGPLLKRLDGDEDAGVRAEAALALGRFVLMHVEGRLRDRYFQRVEQGLHRVIGNPDEIQEVRARAIEAVGPYDQPWVRQAITEAYESGLHRMKVSAVHAMGRSCEQRWLPLLLKELTSDEPELRYEAALACGALEDERAIPHLARLVVDPDEEVKQAGIAALGAIGGAQARGALLMLLDSESEAVREAARQALAEIDFDEDPLAFRHRF